MTKSDTKSGPKSGPKTMSKTMIKNWRKVDEKLSDLGSETDIEKWHISGSKTTHFGVENTVFRSVEFPPQNDPP